jgi:2-succinyl-5-enolpyruvyl-6-hydroxy-3-cyclohexene-1-carboxylate synthase
MVLDVATADINSTARAQATMCATFVDQWIRDGVVNAVIAPGSRSTPMALALVGRPEIHVEIFHDERAAAFAALGVGLASGVPAIVLCTSGTAATHFHAAVVEAHLSDVPMIAVTADRPPELRDVGAAQTIDQTKLFGSAVRWFHDPGVAAVEAAPTWRALARQVLDAAIGSSGPVHLNLPFREPLVAEPFDLPIPYLGAPVVEATVPLLGELASELGSARGIIVAGRGIDDPRAVAALARHMGWPVLADPRSGCRGLDEAISSFDAILRSDAFAAAHRPDVVVHLGEPPASKVLSEWLRDTHGVQVRVSTVMRSIDPSHVVSHRFRCTVSAFCAQLIGAHVGGGGSDWSARWHRAQQQVTDAWATEFGSRPELTEPDVARAVSMFDGLAVVASSMPIRDIEWFGSTGQRARVLCNRGANGIDGTVATAIGAAMATGEPVVVLLGDVALLHDQSALSALAQRSVDVRIIVIDNDGGGIFSFLPQAALLAPDRFEQLFGTPHGTDLCAVGAAHGLPVATVTTAAELHSWLQHPGPWLVRVPSTRDGNFAVHRQLNDLALVSVTTA